jgi:glucosylceramidase
MIAGCTNPDTLSVQVFETSESGNKLTERSTFESADSTVKVVLNPEEQFQEITGFGGSFTEASASLINRLSPENRQKIIEAYFGESGSKYSLTRTHINSSDFSLGNYAYAPEEDKTLANFTVEEDLDDIIPMIKDAMKVSKDGFKIISSPWTAPPWMKDNKAWKGGKLLPEYYPTWALYFEKYLDAYKAEGIDIWGITVENEPLGNDSNWESMHYTPEEMNEFVKNHLGPQLDTKWSDLKILGYDQNRDEHIYKWVDAMYDDKEAAKYFDGTAVHWYASTYEVFGEALTYAHNKAPNKYLIQSEACVDAQVPKWNDDAWYWSKEATDWGWTWAPDDQKYLHPKYVPVYRYARDMIGCLNNWVDGWVDWNMVLDRKGGPNWANNWCIAPVIVDPETDEVYFTPLYYTIAHFSRYIRPGAVRIGHSQEGADIQITAAKNPDGSIVVVVLNESAEAKAIELSLGGQMQKISISAKAIQSIVINS